MRTMVARSLLKILRRERWRQFETMVRNERRDPGDLHDEARLRLTGLLRHACAHVPHFRDICRDTGLAPATISAEDLVHLPRTSKQEMMAGGIRFHDETAPPSAFVPNATGGSSGTWFEHFTDASAREIRIANDMRGRTWTGWRPGDSQAVLWGHAGDNKEAESLRGRLLSSLVHRSVTLNAYDMDDEAIDEYYRCLRDLRPTLVIGYSSALAFLGSFLTRAGLRLPPPRGMLSSAETLSDDHRTAIETYFGCPLLNRYGSREFATIAQQCEEVAGMHVMVDRIWLEVLRPDGSPCDPGEQGEIVVTDLDNRVMPFIRYRTGDLARPMAGRCACGRGFPLLESVDGRTSELIVGRNGKYYSCQSPRLFGADIPGVGQMQLIQDSLAEIEIRVVPDERWSPESELRLVARMRDLLGDVEVSVVEVDRIPPAPSGKYPFTISKVSPFDAS